MATRYERFNEITFEAYCKAAIDKAVLKERVKKAERARWEIQFSALTVPDIAADDDKLKYLESDSDMIENRGQAFRIHSTKLSKALSYLMPKNREIILLFYFTGMTDAEIGGLLKIDRATVNRRRRAAESQLRDLMEGTL